MKMERNKFLAIALGVNISACAAPKPPDAQPAQQELTAPGAKTATPSLVNTPQNSTKAEGSKHGTTDECLERNKDGECVARDPYEDDDETYIPLKTLEGFFDMCVEHDSNDECIKWEEVADCIEVDEDDKCVARHPS